MASLPSPDQIAQLPQLPHVYQADGDYGRISRRAFLGASNALFGLAATTTTIRFILRLKYQKKFQLDDFFLLVGFVFLVAATSILNVMIDDIYWDMEIILGPTAFALAALETPGFADRITQYQQLAFSYEVLGWVTVFAVKMSFLYFFRSLIDRVKRLLLFWKVTVVATIVSFCYCVPAIFISCPHIGLSALQCAQGPNYLKTVAVAGLSIGVDMLTDLLIVAIPVWLLWTVRVRWDQKLILALFLCLSILMVIVAAIRASGAITGGKNVDVQWEIFWEQVEGCIAVIVVSISAFRGVFGIRATRDRDRQGALWYASMKARFRKYTKRMSAQDDGHNLESLPQIPGATITGVHTMIRGKASTQILRSNMAPMSENHLPEEPGVVHVRRDIQMRYDSIDQGAHSAESYV